MANQYIWLNLMLLTSWDRSYTLSALVKGRCIAALEEVIYRIETYDVMIISKSTVYAREVGHVGRHAASQPLSILGRPSLQSCNLSSQLLLHYIPHSSSLFLCRHHL
ncbi:hypothetical protein QL285_080878 [Trifolium repens]|nr:hypothetical protein QL285_080878 [Trifolium repens]